MDHCIRLQHADHALRRRAFLGAARPASLGPRRVRRPPRAPRRAARKAQKRVLVIFLCGGVSQLETLGPEARTPTPAGRSRRSRPSVPGIHICELLPHTAKQMHRLALVRGVNTAEDDHGKGAIIMHTGRRPEPAIEYPHLGAVAAKLLGAERQPAARLHPRSRPAGGGGFGKQDAAFLGPKYASRRRSATASRRPTCCRPAGLTDRRRRGSAKTCGSKLNDRFAKSRRTRRRPRPTPSPTTRPRSVDAQARRLRRRARRPRKAADRYGRHDFGRHCLLARRLLEAGVTFVKVHALELRHAPRELRLPHRAARRVRPARSPRCSTTCADRGMLESDAGRRDVGVRPDAEDQPPLRPRPLVEGLVGGAGRLRHQGRRRRRQDQRQRHRRHRPRGQRRPPVPHLPAGASGSTRRRTSTRTIARSRWPTRRRRRSRKCWRELVPTLCWERTPRRSASRVADEMTPSEESDAELPAYVPSRACERGD